MFCYYNARDINYLNFECAIYCEYVMMIVELLFINIKKYKNYEYNKNKKGVKLKDG